MLDLDSLYDAIEDDGALARLAENLAAACGTRSAVVHQFTPTGQLHFAQMNYWPSATFDRYYQDFLGHDPWREAAEAMGVIGRAVSLDDVLPPERFVDTVMYNELFRPLGDDTGRCIGVVPPRGSEMLIVSVHRPARDAAFDAADRVKLDELYGHVLRILRLRRLLDHERQEAVRLTSMVDGSGRAMLIVDGHLRVLRASAAALRCLEARDGLWVHHGGFVISRSATADAVRRTVKAMIDRRPVARLAFLCLRPSGKPSYRLIVLPAGNAGKDGALIVIEDPASAYPEVGNLQAIGDAYGLTPAELAIVEGLLQGKNLNEIAEMRAVGRETIKTQLKSLFDKTGTNRQAELVRLLSHG